MDPSSPDLSVGMFDVALSTGTSYTTRRAEAAASMMDAVQVFPGLMEIAPDLVAKYQDWPGADKLAERLKKAVPPQFLEPDEQTNAGPQIKPEEIQMMQQEFQKLQQENAAMKMDRSVEDRKLEIDWYKAQTDRIKALSDDAVDNNKMEQDGIAMILDHHSKAEDRKVKAMPKPPNSTNKGNE
jgi:hypothetical protein